jgi:hypothetical protein
MKHMRLYLYPFDDWSKKYFKVMKWVVPIVLILVIAYIVYVGYVSPIEGHYLKSEIEISRESFEGYLNTQDTYINSTTDMKKFFIEQGIFEKEIKPKQKLKNEKSYLKGSFYYKNQDYKDIFLSIIPVETKAQLKDVFFCRNHKVDLFLYALAVMFGPYVLVAGFVCYSRIYLKVDQYRYSKKRARETAKEQARMTAEKQKKEQEAERKKIETAVEWARFTGLRWSAIQNYQQYDLQKLIEFHTALIQDSIELSLVSDRINPYIIATRRQIDELQRIKGNEEFLNSLDKLPDDGPDLGAAPPVKKINSLDDL